LKKGSTRRTPIESPVIRSYRELLGVGPTASEEEIKKAYRSLVVLYHPDKQRSGSTLAGDSEPFLRVTRAYETLSDPAEIEKLNKAYLDKKLFSYPIEGLNVSFGSFFGYRRFSLKRVERTRRIGKEKEGETDADLEIYDLSHSEDSHSILDNPAYDSIELIFAGKFSIGDEERVRGGFGGRAMGQLPWVILNNRGIICFLEGRVSEALKCYEELNERVPNNIIFVYRLGICWAITAFKNQKRGLLGKPKPEPAAFKKAVDNFRRAILLGESRSVGKQKCLTIRKTLADVFERAGQISNANRVWKEIRRIEPDSIEAALKLGGKVPMLGGKKR
jgi:curved DNA-binding protein CbpA